jgi:hypothetical protein
MSVEYAGAGGLAPLRELAKATGHDLEYVVRLANRRELRRLLVAGPIRIHTPLASDKSDMASPQAARLRLLMKRRPPT